MKKLNSQEVRQKQLYILDDVHDFCVKNNIRYSLSGGSLLGAIRHKGFIPWDDDIDIMMPRDDFERFIKTYISKRIYYKIDYYTNDPLYVSAFAKVIDCRTHTVGPNIIDDRYVFIDIFPIDGMPDEYEIDDYVESIQQILVNLRKGGKYYKFTPKLLSKGVFFIKYLIKRIYTPSREKCLQKLDSILKKYSMETSTYAGVSIGQYAKREWMEKKIFDNYILLDFEGRKYYGISDYDTYLKNLYHDYMQLPLEKDRIPMHFDNVFIED